MTDGTRSAAARVGLYAGTTFLSAFLLFQVEPLIGKAILPWFGGGSAVWTATMLFFQVALLGGYAYAHFLSNRLSLRRQALLHIGLLVLAVGVLPIIPREIWRPTGGGDPTWSILLLLAATVGAPYLLLSSTAPLIQRWFAIDRPGASPYRLYSLSNTGSLLALLTYPVVFERFLGLREQAWLWSAAYVAFVVCCATLAWRVSRGANARAEAASADAHEAPSFAEAPAEEGGTAAVTPMNVALWLALPAIASMMLLAATNQLTQDVASLPLLWVLPLALYLLTFIICFGDDRAYNPRRDVPLLALSLALGTWLPKQVTLDLLWQILAYAFVLFMCCVTLHGELVRLRPAAKHLTAFYLMVAVGGAAGGILVAIVAPAIFVGYWEYHLALVATAALVLGARGLEFSRGVRAAKRGLSERQEWLVAIGGVTAVVGVVLLGWTLYGQIVESGQGVIVRGRNFYGTVRVYDNPAQDPTLTKREMEHGRILHGFQYLAPDKRALHSGYYGPKSGLGVAMLNHPGRPGPLRVGVVGLGAGMIASYAERGDTFAVYEINPTVVTYAESDFSYLADARTRGAAVQTYVGDGRLVLEQQIGDTNGPLAGGLDVLLLDAFNSDAVPVHLLTKEAFDLYMRVLKPNGILAVNISNRHVDLSPVIRGLAAAEGKEANWVSGQAGDGGPGVIPSVWMLVTSNRAFLDKPEVKASFQPWPTDARAPMRWTDDFSNVYDLLHLY